MKNYYEILEVNENASPEVIEKAYRTLVKKYHPDLQNNEKRLEYEKKMKEINEAYSVLSNDYKKTTYDEQLKNATVTKEEYQKILQENAILKKRLGKVNQNVQNIQKPQNIQNKNIEYTNNTIINMGRVFQEEIKRVANSGNQEKYTQETPSKKFKPKHELKYYRKYIILIICVILACILIYQIPVVKNFFAQLYEKNIIFRAIVDVFKNTFTTKF